MIDVLNLALPYFGLIFLGFACGKLKRHPRYRAWPGWTSSSSIWRCRRCSTASWPNAVRAAQQRPVHPADHAWRPSLCFALSFVHRARPFRRNLAEATIAALAGAYGNIGYMGPGLALATLGAQAAAPVALIFCFETLLFFSLVPLLMALARRPDKARLGSAALRSGAQDRAASVHDRDRARRRVGGVAFRAAGRARPAAAVPAERRRAVRAVHARRDGGAAADRSACRGRCRSLVADQARRASGSSCCVLLSLLGPFDPDLGL